MSEKQEAWPPPPNVSPPFVPLRCPRRFWPLGGLLIAGFCTLLYTQIDPRIYWGALRWPEAAIPCIALLLGLPWSIADTFRGSSRGNWGGVLVGIVAGLLNLSIGLHVIFLRPK